VGIFQNLKATRRQKVVLRATKNPLRPRNKLSHAPDAVSREYRGKIAARKEYFAQKIATAISRSTYEQRGAGWEISTGSFDTNRENVAPGQRRGTKCPDGLDHR
jgi:hypothetical protein